MKHTTAHWLACVASTLALVAGGVTANGSTESDVVAGEFPACC